MNNYIYTFRNIYDKLRKNSKNNKLSTYETAFKKALRNLTKDKDYIIDKAGKNNIYFFNQVAFDKLLNINSDYWEVSINKENKLEVDKFLSYFDRGDIRKIKMKYYDMKSRCYQENDKDYVMYGGRGIKICEEWLNNIYNFVIWSLTNGYNRDFANSIDRIDNNRNYEPDNCRYVNLEYQNGNRHFSKYAPHYETIIINGREITRSIKQWSLFFNVKYNYMKYIFRSKKTRGKGLKGQEVIDYFKEKKKGIYADNYKEK